MDLEATVRKRYEASGQEHVLEHLTSLPVDEKDLFLKELNEINVENLAALLESTKEQEVDVGKDGSAAIEPFNGAISSTKDKDFSKSSHDIGMKAIREGNVCALVLAGGQGTRLGFDGPKGMYPLLGSKTLFQILAERIIKLQQLAGNDCIIPWYIMTSPMNHQQTSSFLEQNDFFGLKKENVILFQQGVLPCVDLNGKMILETKSKCAMAPDGNGGIYISMKKNGIFEDMRKRNIKYVHAFAIDNALTKPADPIFMGCCIIDKADCGNKVLWKRDASEKVGIVAMKNGKNYVVEYSDMDPKLLEEKDENGTLIYGAANICNHFYTLDFLENVVIPKSNGMYHVAHKKIPFWDSDSNATVTPEKNNGIKLESFIFDVFPLSSRMAILEVLREEEFAPVKNAPGSSTDSPDQAREMISNLAKSWVTKAGATLKGEIDSKSCQVSPLTSYAGEGLEDRFQNEECAVLECPFEI